METSLKSGFTQIFSCCPKNLSCPKFVGAAAPPRPPGPYAYGWRRFARRLFLAKRLQWRRARRNGHVAAARKRSHQWSTCNPATEKIERMTTEIKAFSRLSRQKSRQFRCPGFDKTHNGSYGHK